MTADGYQGEFDSLDAQGLLPDLRAGRRQRRLDAVRRSVRQAGDATPAAVQRDRRLRQRRHRQCHPAGDEELAGLERVARDRARQEAGLRPRLRLGRAGLAGLPADVALPHRQRVQDGDGAGRLPVDRRGQAQAHRQGAGHPAAEDARAAAHPRTRGSRTSRSGICSSTPAASTPTRSATRSRSWTRTRRPSPNGSWHLPVTARDVRRLHRLARHGAKDPGAGHGLQQLRLLPSGPGRREEARQGAPDRRVPGPPVRPACTSTASGGRPA